MSIHTEMTAQTAETGTTTVVSTEFSVRAEAKQVYSLKDDTPKKKKLPIFLFALSLLYLYYVGFSALWVWALLELGDDLLWGFFGVGVSVFGGIIVAVIYSMQEQGKGWWEPVPWNERFLGKASGKCYCCWNTC